MSDGMVWVLYCVTIFSLGITRTFSQAEHISEPRNIQHDGSNIHRLTDSLLTRYPPRGNVVRPRINGSQAIELNVSMSLIRIFEVDELQQSVEFRTFLSMQWSDDFLTWDPDEFDYYKNIHLPSDHIWLPDIAMYRGVSRNCILDSNAVVLHDGRVIFVPACVEKIHCAVDISHFPFDEHNCTLSFGSWAYNSDEMGLSLSSSGFQKDNDFEECPEWTVLGVTTKLVKFSFGNVTYDVVEGSFVIRRNAPLFAYLFLLPAVVLSVITSVVFLLPPRNPEKISIGLGILLSFMILLNILMEQTPKSASTVPLIGHYLTLGSLLIAMSVISATILQKLFNHSERSAKAPAGIKKVCLVIGALLCVRYRPTHNIFVENMNDTYSLSNKDNDRADCEKYPLDVDNEWNFVAQVLDRFFFLVYIIINVVASAIIFSQLAA